MTPARETATQPAVGSVAEFAHEAPVERQVRPEAIAVVHQGVRPAAFADSSGSSSDVPRIRHRRRGRRRGWLGRLGTSQRLRRQQLVALLVVCVGVVVIVWLTTGPMAGGAR